MLDRSHGGNIWPNLKVIDFSASINPLGLPPKAKEVILKNIKSLSRYPDPEASGLKEELAALNNINPNNILVGNGSIELIHLIPRALKAKRVLIVGPTFSEYEFAARSSWTKLIFLLAREKDNFKIDISRIKKIIPEVDLVFLCNPNNPTAFLMPTSDLLDLADLCKKSNTVLVVDEAFIDFIESNKERTLKAEAVKQRHLLVIRSLTKFFALAGLRLGYLIGHSSRIEQISKLKYPWNVNSLAQAAAKEAIKDRDYIGLSKAFILEERAYLFKNLKKIKGLKTYNPSANFIFCKLENSKIQSSLKLNKKLLERDFLIRSCHNFRGLNDRFFRLAVRTRSENKKLISALKELLT